LLIAPEFRSFVGQNGGPQIFGRALGEAYLDPHSGRLVQYFQQMRLEYDPIAQQVSITPLGEWAVPQPANQVLVPVPPEGNQRFFPQTNLIVQDEFLSFYEAHQGEQLFGLPISPQLDEGGMRAQYFQNVRLEWHPAAPLAYRVQVGALGAAHYRQVGAFQDPGRSRPLASAGVNEAIVRASVAAPILYEQEQQTIFVDVHTPDGQRPVEGVFIDLVVTFDGQTKWVRLPETDGEGHSRGYLPLDEASAGQRIQVQVTASAPGGDSIGLTTLTFKKWW
jgi:hypothetical protein